jgi:pimeloyl-ACP methyl ester carboxylesterase
LTSDQALADLASFRQFIQNKYKLSNKNKWISFGGSYPGSLSAWFRLKYPDLVYAAVSSSAPMQAIVDFSNYMVVVNEALSKYSPECPKQIQSAIKQIKPLLRTNNGRRYIQRLFKLDTYNIGQCEVWFRSSPVPWFLGT